MLSQTLPGLREFRVPFASGALWLLGLWLLLRGHIHLPGLKTAAEEAEGLIEPVGLGAALAFSAYLVGVAFESVWSSLWNSLPRLSPTGLRAINQLIDKRLEALSEPELAVYAWTRSPAGRAALEEIALRDETVGSAYERLLGEDEDQARPPETRVLRAILEHGSHSMFRVRRALNRELVLAVRDEIDMVAQQLSGKRLELFHEHDRLKSEGEFRFAIALPLVVVIAGALHDDVDDLLLGFICALLLLVFPWQAAVRRAQSGDLVAGALRYGDVQAPTLEGVEAGRFTLQALVEGTLGDESVGARERDRALGDPWQTDAIEVINRPERFVDFAALSTTNPFLAMLNRFRVMWTMSAPDVLYRRPAGHPGPERQRALHTGFMAGDASAQLEVADFLLARGREATATLVLERVAAWGESGAHLRLGEIAKQAGDAAACSDHFRRALFTAKSTAERQAAEAALAGVPQDPSGA